MSLPAFPVSLHLKTPKSSKAKCQKYIRKKNTNTFLCLLPVGTPVNRIPIMAKQVLDLYMLYQLVTEKGGLGEVINKKLGREITKGLNLPTSITSAAFTLRTP